MHSIRQQQQYECGEDSQEDDASSDGADDQARMLAFCEVVWRLHDQCEAHPRTSTASASHGLRCEPDLSMSSLPVAEHFAQLCRCTSSGDAASLPSHHSWAAR